MHQADEFEIMPLTSFDKHGRYGVEVTEEGVTVYSECCSETMSRETAVKLRDAITTWLMETEKDN
jgi:hypothetical protein